MLYTIFAICIILVGVFSSAFLMKRAIVYRKSMVLSVNLFVLSLCNLWVSGVYSSTLFGAIEVPVLTIGVYIRPAMIFLLLIPSLILKGMKP